MLTKPKFIFQVLLVLIELAALTWAFAICFRAYALRADAPFEAQSISTDQRLWIAIASSIVVVRLVSMLFGRIFSIILDKCIQRTLPLLSLKFPDINAHGTRREKGDYDHAFFFFSHARCWASAISTFVLLVIDQTLSNLCASISILYGLTLFSDILLIMLIHRVLITGDDRLLNRYDIKFSPWYGRCFSLPESRSGWYLTTSLASTEACDRSTAIVSVMLCVYCLAMPDRVWQIAQSIHVVTTPLMPLTRAAAIIIRSITSLAPIMIAACALLALTLWVVSLRVRSPFYGKWATFNALSDFGSPGRYAFAWHAVWLLSFVVISGFDIGNRGDSQYLNVAMGVCGTLVLLIVTMLAEGYSRKHTVSSCSRVLFQFFVRVVRESRLFGMVCVFWIPAIFHFPWNVEDYEGSRSPTQDLMSNDSGVMFDDVADPKVNE